MLSMSRHAKCLGVLVSGSLLLLLALLVVWPKPVIAKVHLRLAGTRQSSNGVLLVTVILTNGTPQTLNVVDDADGNPALVLDTGGQHRRWLTPMVNQLKINLAPGASMTNTVAITTPPPRFRLVVPLRDLAAEIWGWQVFRFIPQPLSRWANVVVKWSLRKRLNIYPASEWIVPEPREDS
jgi:hypothetical protein